MKILRYLLELLFRDRRRCALGRWDFKRALGCGFSVMVLFGVFALVAGCHGKRQEGDRSLLERIKRVGQSKVMTPKPGELAAKGRAEIVEECGKQSYDMASKGLIVSETGLHEDVFVLRDRVTYGGIGYSLDEALRLESELQAEAKGGAYSTGQAECIAKFALHMEGLSDPLVEGDARLRELDAAAFTDSEKEAERQAERKLREADKAVDGAKTSPEQKDY